MLPSLFTPSSLATTSSRAPSARPSSPRSLPGRRRPLLAWQELERDDLHGFGFVEEFASRIDLDLDAVVPREVDSPKATLSRQQAGERLYALIEEWKAHAAA